MKYISKKLFLFPALAMLISLAAYSKLPEQIPIHFDFHGVPDNYSSKLFILLMPLIMAAVLLLAEYLPKADPKSANYAKFPKAYQLIQALTQAMLFIAHLTTIAYPLLQMDGNLFGITIFGEFGLTLVHLISAFVGILFIIIGNYMPKFKQSFFCGIKTPWAVSDEENWYKTHRFGGKLWVIGGILLIINPYLPETIATIVFIINVLIMVVAPYFYSYLLFRQKTK